VQAVSALDLGTVRICAFPSANSSLVPQAAARLRQVAPHMRLELIEEEPPASYGMLRRAECDIVVGFSYDGDDSDELAAGMVRTSLLDEPLELLVPVGHELASHVKLEAGHRPTPVPLAELAPQSWIAGCPKCRVTFTDACEAAGFEPDIVCSTDDNMALQSLVASGLGVALTPRMVLSFLHHPGIVAVPVEPVTWRRVAAYTWPDLVRVDAIAKTLEALQAVAVSR
jgi:DNA-binding transcriptional LysR family regulator